MALYPQPVKFYSEPNKFNPHLTSFYHYASIWHYNKECMRFYLHSPTHHPCMMLCMKTALNFQTNINMTTSKLAQYYPCPSICHYNLSLSHLQHMLHVLHLSLSLCKKKIIQFCSCLFMHST